MLHMRLLYNLQFYKYIYRPIFNYAFNKAIHFINYSWHKVREEFEKYRVIQDRLFMSDFDKFMLELEENTKK